MAGFHDVVGHEKTIDRLKSAIRNDRVSHAYLFAGDAGSGKKTLARAFAQALQCQSRTEDGDACGTTQQKTGYQSRRTRRVLLSCK